MLPRLALVLVAAATLIACSGTGPSENLSDYRASFGDTVVVEATEQTLRITNNSDRPIFYLLFEREFGELWLPPPPDPATTPRVAPGAVTTVPYGDILGFGPHARQALFGWGHLVPATDGVREFYVFDALRWGAIRL